MRKLYWPKTCEVLGALAARQVETKLTVYACAYRRVDMLKILK
jgi:hypothetical protein